MPEWYFSPALIVGQEFLEREKLMNMGEEFSGNIDSASMPTIWLAQIMQQKLTKVSLR
jgi:hypothetical protein